MTDTPERIYAWVYRDGDRMHHNWRGAVTPCGLGQTEYIRATDYEALAAKLVRAALERAIEKAHDKLYKKKLFVEYQAVSDAIRAIAKDDEAVEAIITSVLGEPK